MIVFVSLALAGRPDELGYVASEERAFRCHYTSGAGQELCGDVVAWAEEAWEVQVDRLGFAAPVSDEGAGGSDDLDLYLSTEGTGGAGGAFVACDGDDPPCPDSDGTDGRAAGPSWIVIDPRTDATLMRSYVHHEFNHVLQYATDWAEPALSFWEGTATAAETWTDDTQQPDPSFIADYQATPWVSAVLQDGYFLDEAYGIWSYYEYGATVWVRWMDERWGDGRGWLGPQLWELGVQEGATNEPDVLDVWDMIAPDWRDDLLLFAADRARMGTSDGPDWLGSAGTSAHAWREDGVDAPPARLSPTLPPYPLGMSYFTLPAEAGERYHLEVSGDAATTWGLVVVEGDGYTTTRSGAVDHEVLADGDVTLGVVNLGPDGLDGDDELASAEFVLRVDREFRVMEPGCGCATGGQGPGLAAMGLAVYAVRRGGRAARASHRHGYRLPCWRTGCSWR